MILFKVEELQMERDRYRDRSAKESAAQSLESDMQKGAGQNGAEGASRRSFFRMRQSG